RAERRTATTPRTTCTTGRTPHDHFAPDRSADRRAGEQPREAVVARRRRLPGLPPLVRRLGRRRDGRPARRHRASALPARPRRRRDLALALLHLSAERRRLGRG